jgi:membrane-anchored protein YejM (alkaline phosphatase superfamily)
MRKGRGLKLLATIPITVTPSPPPGIGQAVSTLLTWLMWLGWIVVVAAFILGGMYLALGDSEKGKKYITGAIIGAIVMAFYTAVLNGLINF